MIECAAWALCCWAHPGPCRIPPAPPPSQTQLPLQREGWVEAVDLLEAELATLPWVTTHNFVTAVHEGRAELDVNVRIADPTREWRAQWGGGRVWGCCCCCGGGGVRVGMGVVVVVPKD